MELQIGDVFKLEKGMRVYGLIPEKFVYDNRKTSNELTRHEIKIGEVIENDVDLASTIKKNARGVVDKFSSEGIEIETKKVIKFVTENVGDVKKEQFVINEGEYLVVRTAFDGGGTGHGSHDVYPDGHHVFCKALRDGKYEEDGDEIDFYQSGSFTCVIRDIKPIRKMKKTVNFE